MSLARPIAVVALASSLLAGCGPGVPPVQNYATITGTVVDATSGAPVSGAIVNVSVISSSPTSTDGKFSIYPIPTGPYSSIGAQAPNYQPYTDNSGGTLSPGQTLSVVIRMTHS